MPKPDLETLHAFLTGKLQAVWPTALVFEIPGIWGPRFVARRDGLEDFYLNPVAELQNPQTSGRSFQAARRAISCIAAAEKAKRKSSEDPARADK